MSTLADPALNVLRDAEDRDDERAEVAVIGLGYVGITLAVALADAGVRVLGHDSNTAISAALAAGVLPVKEPGVEEGLARSSGAALKIKAELPDTLPPTVIICVGTPVDHLSSTPDLSQLQAATAAIAARIGPETLVVLRSTVPVGTSRRVVLEALRREHPNPRLAFCPERTIQGRALEELHRLPQIVGASTADAAEAASELFAKLTPRVIQVSSLEAAEAIKLVCNAHTDLIYGFGNEVALMAEALGLDAEELISSANLDYPRPDISRPGFVGGGCLTKDPYLLAHSTEQRDYTPSMVLGARRLNEAMPVHAARRVLDALAASGVSLAESKVLISGIAFKGQPATDDVRGAASRTIAEMLREEVGALVGHDFTVPPEQIAAVGLKPVTIEEGFEGASAVMVLIDHPGYRLLDLRSLSGRMSRPAVAFDAFGVLGGPESLASGVAYLRLGSA
jgi:UDP-N-acetyl-D-mannosaminuronic acid dehydrogenase